MLKTRSLPCAEVDDDFYGVRRGHLPREVLRVLQYRRTGGQEVERLELRTHPVQTAATVGHESAEQCRCAFPFDVELCRKMAKKFMPRCMTKMHWRAECEYGRRNPDAGDKRSQCASGGRDSELLHWWNLTDAQ